MRIPFDAFEQHISEGALKQGMQLFKRNQVTSLDELSPGEFLAMVHDQETYEVTFAFKGSMIEELHCPCDHPHGQACAHLAAVLLYMQQSQLGLTPIKPRTTKSGGISKSKTVAEKADEVLQRLPAEELRAYLNELFAIDRKLRQLFMAKYGQDTAKPSKAAYLKQIKALLATVKTTRGNMVTASLRKVQPALEQLIVHAEAALGAKQLELAACIGMAMIEAMRHVLRKQDGPANGLLEQLGFQAIQVIDTLAQANPPAPLREQLRADLNTEFEQATSWIDTLRVPIGRLIWQLACTPQELQQVLLVMDSYLQRSTTTDYQIDDVYQMVQECALAKMDAELAHRFMRKHIDHVPYLDYFINKAIADKEYQKALTLIDQGIGQHQSWFDSIKCHWRDKQLGVYQAMGDKRKLVAHLLHMVSRTPSDADKHPLEHYYTLLKNEVKEQDWPAVLQTALDACEAKGCAQADSIRKLELAALGRRTDLLLPILGNPSQWALLKTVAPALLPEYANEVGQAYRQAISLLMQSPIASRTYETVMNLLKELADLGLRQHAIKIIDELLTASKRRTLLTELLAEYREQLAAGK